jgi:hypothetical protein
MNMKKLILTVLATASGLLTGSTGFAAEPPAGARHGEHHETLRHNAMSRPHRAPHVPVAVIKTKKLAKAKTIHKVTKK